MKFSSNLCQILCLHACMSKYHKVKLNFGTYTPNYLVYSGTCLERPPHWPQKCGLSSQVVSGDRFSCTEM